MALPNLGPEEPELVGPSPEEGASQVDLNHTKGRILNQLTIAKKIGKDWHDEIKRMRRLYYLDHYSTRPKPNEARYPDPTATNVVDQAVGILMANDIEWRAIGFGPDADTQEATSRVEKYLVGTLEIAIEREAYHHPYEVYLHGSRDGAFVVRSVWDPILAQRHGRTGLVPDPTNLQTGVKPVRIFDESPVKTDIIDPLEIHVIPGGPNRFRALFREVEMNILDAETTYGFTSQKHGRLNATAKMQQKGKLIDYWAIDDIDGQLTVVNAVIFDGEFIPGYEPIAMNGYEDIPITIGFFKPTDRANPKYWGHGLLQPIEPSLKFLESIVNRQTQQINTFTGLPMVVQALPGRDVDIDPGFGQALVISTEEQISFPLWPGNPPDVAQHLQFFETRMQQSGFSDLTLNAAAQASGFALSQLSDQNSVRLQMPIKQFEMFWSTWAKKVLRLTRNFGGNSVVRVYGRLRGRDFADQFVGEEIADFLVRARIKPEWPGGAVRKHALATQARGVLADTTIMENYYDIEQPDDERQKRLQEQAENHPIMQLLGVIEVLTDKASAGGKGSQAAMMTLQILQQQGVPGMGGPGAGPGGPGVEQPVGLQSSTGDPTNQATGDTPDGTGQMSLLGDLVGASASPSGEVV